MTAKIFVLKISRQGYDTTYALYSGDGHRVRPFERKPQINCFIKQAGIDSDDISDEVASDHLVEIVRNDMVPEYQKHITGAGKKELLEDPCVVCCGCNHPMYYGYGFHIDDLD